MDRGLQIVAKEEAARIGGLECKGLEPQQSNEQENAHGYKVWVKVQ
jgi:hypothetical protein